MTRAAHPRSPASATSSWATTPSASRSPAGLAARDLPEGVRVVDFGIRGLDLTYALLDGYEAVILVDAAPRGGPPGTLYVIEPDRGRVARGRGTAGLVETHGMDPVKVLRLAAAMGGQVERLLLVGCEPEPPGDAGRDAGRA